MKPEAIFLPVSVLALWTSVVLLVTGYRRIRALKTGRILRRVFKLGESPDVPPDIAVANRNLMNLLEMPLLFYVVCIALYVTRHVEVGLVWLAWSYVAMRIVHSFIHLTTNRVVHRFVPFALSNVVLVSMWFWLLSGLV